MRARFGRVLGATRIRTASTVAVGATCVAMLSIVAAPSRLPAPEVDSAHSLQLDRAPSSPTTRVYPTNSDGNAFRFVAYDSGVTPPPGKKKKRKQKFTGHG